MGNICTTNFQKQQTTETTDSRTCVKYSITLGTSCTIDLVTGNFRQHKSDSLLAFTESSKIDLCEPLREYIGNYEKTIETINTQGKIFYKTSQLSKTCPYKKLLLAIMPKYASEESQQYQQHLKNIMRQVLTSSKQITIQMTNTIEGLLQLPNQMILAIIFRQLQQWKSPVKVNLISNEKKMMHLYKFQLLKTDNCKLKFQAGEGKEIL